ncbi:MAG: fibronectin type III domain-containing protein, partial [Actinomycetota bacterium]
MANAVSSHNAYPGPIAQPNIPSQAGQVTVNGVIAPLSTTDPSESGTATPSDPTYLCGFTIYNGQSTVQAYIDSGNGNYLSNPPMTLTIDPTTECVEFQVVAAGDNTGTPTATDASGAQVYVSLLDVFNSGTAAQDANGDTFLPTLRGNENIKIVGLHCDSTNQVNGCGNPKRVGEVFSYQIAPSVPDKVAGVTAVTAYLGAQVSWSPALTPVGYPVTQYVVTSSNTSGKPNGTCTTSGTACAVTIATSATFTAATLAATNYTFTVKATNAVGTSPVSNPSAAVKPRTSVGSVPFAPTNLTVTPHNGNVSASWAAAYGDGLTLTAYNVNVTTVGVTWQPTTVVNSDGSLAGSSNNDYVVTLPDVTDISVGDIATLGGAQVGTVSAVNLSTKKVTISPESTFVDSGVVLDQSSSITFNYAVSSPKRISFVGCSTLATSCVISNLTNATTYSFTVTAQAGTKTSSASAAVTATPNIFPPNPPTNLTAVAYNEEVHLSWTASTFDGGSPVTGYSVYDFQNQVSANGFLGDHCTTNATTTDCWITGLTNGTAYTFYAFATNYAAGVRGSGASAPSLASKAVTPMTTAPWAPTAVQGSYLVGQANSATGGKINVSWTSNTYNAGAATTQYTVTSSPGAKTCIWTTGPLNCTVSGLTVGTAYTFSVTAKNSVGTSPASAASTPVISYTVPSAATGVSGSIRYQGSTVSWTAPTSTGGTSITSYVATAYLTSSTGAATTATAQFCTWVSGPLNCVISGLTNGVKYAYEVVAVNSAGSSITSAASAAVTPGYSAPDAPTLISAKTGNQNIVLTWAAPVYTGGGAQTIASYTVTYLPNTVGSSGCTNLGPSATTCTISGLTNGTSYTISIVDKNSGLVGPPVIAALTSAAVSPATALVPSTAPSAPTSVSATAKQNQQSVVTWSVPSSTGGATITSYVVTAIDATNPANGNETCTWTTGPLTCTITGLTNGDSYTFTVTATNISGTSVASS